MEQIKDWFGKDLTVAVATDHGGFELKKELLTAMAERNIKISDFGPYELDASDDYPDFSNEAAKAVSFGQADCAILICRSGIGMSINANRYNYVRAALVANSDTAKKSRSHNCSNVLVLSGDSLDTAGMMEIVDAWLATPYSNEDRHSRRLEKIEVKS
ncbi:MAG: RpiB/LacA/LacB family sugar-phosphate isomerase, partial [Victivallaceae bacterium]|nr:RpiB/LacA/LacB family sugar-phosphate isomerase [Victivallaceae bacterium]